MELVNLLSLMLCCVISTVTAQGSAFHEDHSFNCPESNNQLIRNSEGKIRSLSLTSPCYPADYYWTCDLLEICYITIQNIPQDAWIGLYIAEEYLVPALSTDTIQILIDGNQVLLREQLVILQPGFLYRYSQQLPRDEMLVALARPNARMGSRDNTVYTFQVDVKFAYIMGRHNNVAAEDGGYIVSHENFDEGKDTNNNYTEGITVQLTLNGLSNNNILRLKFLTFYLRYSQVRCDDYLVVSGVRGYPRGETSFCDPITANSAIDLYPASDEVTFTFVTGPSLVFNAESSAGSSAGFLISYEAIGSTTECPPDIPSSKPAVQITGTLKYNIECETGYWTTNNSTLQIIDCINDIWRTTMSPCILQPQPTTILPSTTKEQTTNEKTTSQPMTDTEGQVDDESDLLPAYIGGGVGALVLVVLIVVLVLFLVRRRQNRNTESRKRALSPQSTPSLTDDNDVDRNNRGDIYYLADEDETNSDNRLPQHLATTSTEVYELAELEDTYENSFAIDRFECEKDISQDYAPVLAVSKTKKTPDESVDIMIENDLYGT